MESAVNTSLRVDPRTGERKWICSHTNLPIDFPGSNGRYFYVLPQKNNKTVLVGTFESISMALANALHFKCKGDTESDDFHNIVAATGKHYGFAPSDVNTLIKVGPPFERITQNNVTAVRETLNYPLQLAKWKGQSVDEYEALKEEKKKERATKKRKLTDESEAQPQQC